MSAARCYTGGDQNDVAAEMAVLVLDLRWLLFACLLLAVGASWGVPWLQRRARRGQTRWRAGDLRRIAPTLEHAPFGLLILDGPRMFGYANVYARRILGLAATQGTLPDEAWTQALDEDRMAADREKAGSGRYRSLSLPSDSSSRFVRWWVTALGDADLVCVLDATAQHQAEVAGQSLLGNLSHELRTPLATILTHLEVLSLPNLPPETVQQSLRLSKTEAQRMARMVHLMLEIGRLETGGEIERRRLDLLSLLDTLVAQITPQAKVRGIGLTLEAEAPLPEVAGDEDRLRQAFLNLLDNAIRYSRPGDRVLVSLRREGEAIRCAVRDNGPGVAPQHLPHLTRRFYRAAPQDVEGSGLGLALVEEILERHGSRLEIESRAEGTETGTCVAFSLPVLAPTIAPVLEG